MEECTCGTGSYCHRHHRYNKASKFRVDRSQSSRDDDEKEIDNIVNAGSQRCGGGRRLMRKQPGGDNY